MFPKRWHHGHSLGTGALGGIVIYGYAPYLLVGIGVAFGAAAVCLGMVAYRLGSSLLGGFEAWRAASRAKSESIAAGPVAVYGRRSAQNRDGVPF